MARTRKHPQGREVIHAVWRFTPSNAGIWLACSYAGTSMVAAFGLPNGIRSCEVDHDAKSSQPAAATIDCR
jgi:hypothetical protein